MKRSGSFAHPLTQCESSNECAGGVTSTNLCQGSVKLAYDYFEKKQGEDLKGTFSAFKFAWYFCEAATNSKVS